MRTSNLQALARMELQVAPRLLDGITAASLAKLPKMNPQNVANILWVRNC